jgi:plasmid stability protein
MAQVVVRNVDEYVKIGLKFRASQHGWSMEEEIRQILQRACWRLYRTAQMRRSSMKLTPQTGRQHKGHFRALCFVS